MASTMSAALSGVGGVIFCRPKTGTWASGAPCGVPLVEEDGSDHATDPGHACAYPR